MDKMDLSLTRDFWDLEEGSDNNWSLCVLMVVAGLNESRLTGRNGFIHNQVGQLMNDKSFHVGV